MEPMRSQPVIRETLLSDPFRAAFLVCRGVRGRRVGTGYAFEGAIDFHLRDFEIDEPLGTKTYSETLHRLLCPSVEDILAGRLPT